MTTPYLDWIFGTLSWYKSKLIIDTACTDWQLIMPIMHGICQCGVIGRAIQLSTLTSRANDLKDALWLDNEVSAWAATCLSGSVLEVETMWAFVILHKIAKFFGVYIKFRHANWAEILSDIVESVFLIVTKFRIDISHRSVVHSPLSDGHTAVRLWVHLDIYRSTHYHMALRRSMSDCLWF